jgi:hypothetical protein
VSDGKAHSKLGASSYDRWGECPGSVKLSEGIPNESSIYAEEGTLAHEVGSRILLGTQLDGPVDDEMLEAVQVYLEHIWSLRALNPSFEAIEQRVDLSAYHPALFGTADYVAYFADTKTLHVVDYKHGRGVPVEVVGSRQLRYYGLGALHMNKFPIASVILTIVQPRCYHVDGPVRSWAVDPVEMLDFAADLISDALKTENPNAPLNPGDHCRWCPAQAICPALQKQSLDVVQAAFQDETLALPPARVAYFLGVIPQIKSWIESVHKYAHSQAELGVEIPGWKLVDKRATRKWRDDFQPPADESRWWELKVKSPAAMEKVLGKGVIDDFVIKESSGKTLVPTTDDREAQKGQLELAFKQE